MLENPKWQRFANSKSSSEKRRIYQGCLLTADVHAIFFAEQPMLEALKEATMLQVDGTFKVCPRRPEMRQLLTLQFRRGDHVS
jgi:hypothetical protein